MGDHSLKETIWTLASVASAVIGLHCYALSSSFHHLFGEWNPWKITLYNLLSSITFLVAILAKDWESSSILTSLASIWKNSRICQFRSVTTFLVMLLTTIFSFFSDRVAAGAAKPDAYSVVSSVAFSAMSLILSKDVPFIFEELMYFFLGTFIAQMMKIKLLLGFFVGILVSFFFVILKSKKKTLVVAHDLIEEEQAQANNDEDEEYVSAFDIEPTENAHLVERNVSTELEREEERGQVRRNNIQNHAIQRISDFRRQMMRTESCLADFRRTTKTDTETASQMVLELGVFD